MKNIIIALVIFLSIFYKVDAKEHEKVSLQLQWLEQFQFAGYLVAKHKGFYEDVGLDVEIKPFNYSILPIDEVMENRANYSIGRSSLIIDKINNKDIVALASIFQSSPFILLALKNENLKNLEDFVDKNIMITPDAYSTTSFQAMLKSKDLSLNDLNLQKHSFNIEDLINKNTDIMASYASNEPYFLESQDIAYTIFDPKDYGFDFYSDILFTSKKEIEENPKRAENFLNASLRGWEYAFSNIEESVDILYKHYNPQNKTKEALRYEAEVLKELAYYKTNKIGEIKKEKIKRILDIYNVMGLNKKVDDEIIDDFIYNRESFLNKNYINYIKKLTIYCNINEIEPFLIKKEDRYEGIIIDYLNLIQSRIDFDFNCEKDLSSQKGFFFATPFEDIQETKDIIKYPVAVAMNDDKPFSSDLNYLNNKKVAIVKNDVLINKLQKEFPQIDLIRVDNIEEGFKLVSSNEAFAIIDALPILNYNIQKHGFSHIRILGITDINYPINIKVPSDDKKLLEILNMIIDEISDSEKKAISDKWLPMEDKEKIDKDLVIYIMASILALLIALLIVLFIYRNIQKRLQKRIDEEVEKNREKDKILYSQNKHAAMGEMIGNIAHQWRQPLNELGLIIQTFKFYEEKEIKESKDMIHKKVDKGMNLITKMSTTIDDFRDFFKPDKNISNFNVEDTINDTIKMFEASSKYNDIRIVLDSKYKDDISTYKGELEQVIMNILNNAKDVLVKENIEDRLILIQSAKKDNNLIINILDNAGGIPKEVLSNIFIPYFTSKENGTGIGLSMSKEIIEEHMKGELSAKNSFFNFEGERHFGAHFTIKLDLK